jgi:hypothetical protein
VASLAEARTIHRPCINGLLRGLADEICGKLKNEVTGVVTEYLSTLERFGSVVNSLIVFVLL